MINLQRISFEELVTKLLNMHLEDWPLRLADTLTFEEANWCIQVIYDTFSGTEKLLITHMDPVNHPSVILDFPCEKEIATWKIWLEHILRIKTLLTIDRFAYIERSGQDGEIRIQGEEYSYENYSY